MPKMGLCISNGNSNFYGAYTGRLITNNVSANTGSLGGYSRGKFSMGVGYNASIIEKIRKPGCSSCGK